MIKGILFDFDGVLTTDANGSTSTCNYICKETGVDYDLFKNEYYKYNKDLNCGKITHEEIWSDLCRGINKDIDIDILYKAFINTPINNEMINLAKKLKDKNYKIGMVTDNKKDRKDMIADYYNLNKIFDVITVSAEIGSEKDNTEIFEYTIQKLMLRADECVFIDNQEKNLIVPKEMGINTIYYDHNERDLEKLIKNLEILGVEI